MIWLARRAKLLDEMYISTLLIKLFYCVGIVLCVGYGALRSSCSPCIGKTTNLKHTNMQCKGGRFGWQRFTMPCTWRRANGGMWATTASGSTTSMAHSPHVAKFACILKMPPDTQTGPRRRFTLTMQTTPQTTPWHNLVGLSKSLNWLQLGSNHSFCEVHQKYIFSFNTTICVHCRVVITWLGFSMSFWRPGDVERTFVDRKWASTVGTNVRVWKH